MRRSERSAFSVSCFWNISRTLSAIHDQHGAAAVLHALDDFGIVKHDGTILAALSTMEGIDALGQGIPAEVHAGVVHVVAEFLKGGHVWQIFMALHVGDGEDGKAIL